MTLRNILMVVAPTLLVLWGVIGLFGTSWGLTADHVETTKGLLLGLGLGLLAWLVFVIWKEKKTEA